MLSQAFYFEATAKLTGDMLVKVDRMSMANSLEVRCPLLDHRLAELAATIPARWKMHNGEGKACFTESIRRRLPETVWNRRKQGFSVPLSQWFRGPLRSFLRDHLTSPEFFNRDLVSPQVRPISARRARLGPARQQELAVAAVDGRAVVPRMEGRGGFVVLRFLPHRHCVTCWSTNRRMTFLKPPNDPR